MKYLPFLTGTYSTAPGLVPITRTSGKDQYVFQIDEKYAHYIENKQRCREEDIKKYYLDHRPLHRTIRSVNEYIARQLVKEYPGQFSLETNNNSITLINNKISQQLIWDDSDWHNMKHGGYLSLFDALCCQVQEDIAVWQLGPEEDYLCAIHLCSPNHWSPSDKIGKPFHAVHGPVPAMERTLLHYPKMLASIAGSTVPSTRFAWGIATDKRLNHHPMPPEGVDPNSWKGRLHDKDTDWYIRSERQNLIGFPEANAFMFTIRTYFYRVDELGKNEKTSLLSALKSMSPQTLEYKGLTGSLDLLLKKLV